MNRRDFVKTTGAGVFAIATARTLFGAAVPSGKVSVAIIGCARTAQHADGCVVDPKGGRGRGFQLMSRFAELPECEVSVLCDVDSAALDLAAQTVKQITGKEPRKVKDFREVLADPTIDAAVKSNLLTEIGNVSMLVGDAVHINPATGRLKDPGCAAAKFWTRQYEPGWEVKA